MIAILWPGPPKCILVFNCLLMNPSSSLEMVPRAARERKLEMNHAVSGVPGSDGTASPAPIRTAAGTPDQENRAGKPARPWLYVWAIVGVLLLLSQAIFRLSQIAWEAMQSGIMSREQWILCAAWALANCYLEGYRGFHLRFVPRVVARAHALSQQPHLSHPLLAPLFSMAFFHAARKAKGAAWGVTIAVLLAIFLVRKLPQPWRGIIDAGVVAGLVVGTLSLLFVAFRALRGTALLSDPELPPPVTASTPPVGTSSE